MKRIRSHPLAIAALGNATSDQAIRPAARPLTICHALDVLQLCDIIQWLTSTKGHRLVLPQMPWGFESHRIEMG